MTSVTKRRERIDRGIKVRSDGLYALSSWREASYIFFPRAALVAFLLIMPLVAPSTYWLRVLGMAGAFALLAICYDFIANRAGLVCIGGALMVGVGGYISGGLNYYFHLPPVLTIFAGTFGGAIVCTAIFLPCLPLRGIYFAVVTLLLPFLVNSIILAGHLWGGTEGLGPITEISKWVAIYLIMIVVLFTTFGLRRLAAEDIGLVLTGIKDNYQAVEASGINTTRLKMQALFISSAVGCFAGAYLAHFFGFVGLSLFAIEFSIMPIAATVMGGAGGIAGPVIGAFILTPLSELLRGFGQLRVVLYCAILVAFILFKPEGLLSWISRKYYQFERWKKV